MIIINEVIAMDGLDFFIYEMINGTLIIMNGMPLYNGFVYFNIKYRTEKIVTANSKSFSFLLKVFVYAKYSKYIGVETIYQRCHTLALFIVFNKTKYAIGVGGGISIFFLVSSILGLFGSEVMPLALRIDSMNFFNYLTIIRLFDVQSILDGTSTFYYLLIPLLAISVVTYLVGCVVFTKKDLPL